MHFSFDDDQLAMGDAVRDLCADRFALDRVASREGVAADAATWSGLAELGVLGMLVEDSGVGTVEAAIVFEELGAHLASGPVLWSVLAAPVVEGVADGAVRVTGVDRDVVVEHAAEADALLLLDGDRLERCDRSDLPSSASGEPIDPLTPVAVFSSVPRGTLLAEGDAVQRFRRDGTILSAAMLVGGAQGALDVARNYALAREQFGVPIGSFQAIKHLLADMYVRVELARAATYAAAAIADGRGAGDENAAASTAKVLAGEAGIANARAAIQILGGMGFTWDMLPHYFLKRAWVLEHGFGTASAHAARLGTALGQEAMVS